MNWRCIGAGNRWVSECKRFVIQRRPGKKGVYAYLYDAYDSGVLFQTNSYSSEARRACQLRMDGKDSAATAFGVVTSTSAVLAESSSCGAVGNS
jgi:hypothetical protein